MATRFEIASLDDLVKLEQARKLKAERKAYDAERIYHKVQTQRLIDADDDEAANLASQRVYDFTADVSFGSVRSAINTTTEWAAKDAETPITFRILTFGGDLFAALALYDHLVLLNKSGTKTDTVALGVCASAGMVLLQGGATRYVTPNAWCMIHEISSVAEGRLSEIVDESKWVQRAQRRMLDILAERATMSTAQIKRKWTRKDWWLEAEECVRLGFADEVA